MAESSRSTARAVADAAVAEWTAIAEALGPVVGASSVTALYRRCLVSVSVARPWLRPAASGDLAADDWMALHASVSRQAPKEAAETCEALVVAFRALLGSLIGPSLTEQLLRPVSALPLPGSAEQDTLP